MNKGIEAHLRHASYYAEVAETINSSLGERKNIAKIQYDQEIGQIRAASRWVLKVLEMNEKQANWNESIILPLKLWNVTYNLLYLMSSKILLEETIQTLSESDDEDIKEKIR